MWLIRGSVEDAQGKPLAGCRVLAAFQLQLVGVGDDLFMPAEAVATPEGEGRWALRLPAVDAAVSQVSAVSGVRARLVERQRVRVWLKHAYQELDAAEA